MSRNKTPKIVMSLIKKDGLLKQSQCFLIAYEDQTALSILSSTKQKEENKKVSERLKSENKGFFKGTAEMMHFWADYHERFYIMDANQVLAEDPSNFLMDNKNIEKIVFTPRKEGYSSDDGSSNSKSGKLTIESNGQKYQFTHQYDKDSKLTQILLHLYGSALKIK